MSFFDRILRALEGYFTSGDSINETYTQIKEIENFLGLPVRNTLDLVLPIDTGSVSRSSFELDIWRRKFVSGLFYCSGKRQNYYALTFEDNDTDRELDLLSELEFELSSKCSNMRDNYGYSEQDVEEIPQRASIWPDVEIGIL